MKDITVLVVDDEVNITRYYDTILKRRYQNVITCNSAKKALELLKEKSVDILVTDLRMPEMSGFELVDIVSKTYPEILSIVTTAEPLAEDQMSELMARRVYGFLFKPSDLQEVFSCFDEVDDMYDQKVRIKKTVKNMG